ncbi:MAG TPA: PEP/pyruvate-binding domain-containing protein [Candidatus Krumholzibacteria bacterium]|nr:PEP/pyruvate-binding domain-containing protein [Candidatus Krumholzibacteria bacterium]
MTKLSPDEVPRFTREFFGGGECFSRIGEGELGGKARGLVFIKNTIESEIAAGRFPGVTVDIPTTTVIATGVFDAFVERNGLAALATSDTPDDRIALAFQAGEMPVEVVGDLRALVEQVHTPLAVRSSSLLEDAMFRPFAGVYQTKMIPNNQPDPNVRFRRLLEAIKFVYASVYSRRARSYLRTCDRSIADEKMAVIIQEVVGERHDRRFYPDLSGVGRSYNFYPTGGATPDEGVVNLALGLGKTIVDGGVTWSYSPAHPGAPPPFGSASDLLRNTQSEFWAVNMGDAPEYDPVAETEYLVKSDLHAAEMDDTLRWTASTYDGQRDRVVMGTGVDGPRVLTFAPLLEMHDLPFQDVVSALLDASGRAFGAAVEFEFAALLPRERGAPLRIAFLQVRPMVVSEAEVSIEDDELASPALLLASDRVMGNGADDTIRDVVFVRPERFEARDTRAIAGELERLNLRLLDEGRRYLLIGFGRWGSSDPWLGIPVAWGDICGAGAIVEATLPSMNVELSQGSHFFHNITSFQVSYLAVRHDRQPNIDWDWLRAQTLVEETEHVCHVRSASPLRIKVDGRSGRGAIWHA